MVSPSKKWHRKFKYRRYSQREAILFTLYPWFASRVRGRMLAIGIACRVTAFFAGDENRVRKSSGLPARSVSEGGPRLLRAGKQSDRKEPLKTHAIGRTAQVAQPFAALL